MPEAIAAAFPVQTLEHHSILSIILGAGWVVKGVMLMLTLFSLICWAIIITKAIQLSRARKHTQLFLDAFRESRKFSLLVRRGQNSSRSAPWLTCSKRVTQNSVGSPGSQQGGQEELRRLIPGTGIRPDRNGQFCPLFAAGGHHGADSPGARREFPGNHRLFCPFCRAVWYCLGHHGVIPPNRRS